MQTNDAGSAPLERRVRRVRINVGAPISQDMAFGRWPSTASGEAVDLEMEFDAEWDGRHWNCRADGFGRRAWLCEPGGYGNGSITVLSAGGVTLLDDGPNGEL